MSGLRYPIALALVFLLTGHSTRAQTSVSGTIDSNTSWSLSGSPYQLTSDLRLSDNSTLTIEPGVVVDIGRDEEIYILDSSKLVANGVTFEGYRYSNSSIRVHDPSNDDRSRGQIQIDNSSFEDVYVYMTEDAQDSFITNSNIISGSRISNSSSKSLQAQNNFWGDSSGPTHSSNPGGSGSVVSDNVIFSPWATTAIQIDQGGDGGGTNPQYSVDIAIDSSDSWSIDDNFSKDFDQDRVVAVFRVNNTGSEAIRNVQVGATLSGSSITADLNLYTFDQLDSDSDGLIDSIPAGGSVEVAVYSDRLSGSISNQPLVFSVDAIDGTSTSYSQSEKVSHFFARRSSDGSSFTYGRDQYQFSNLDAPSLAEWKSGALSGVPVSMIMDWVVTQNGRCYGMSGSVGRYFLSPELKPLSGEPNSWSSTSADVTEPVTNFHVIQFREGFTENLGITSRPAHADEYSELTGLLRNGEPAIVAMYISDKQVHAVLATKATVLHDSGVTLLGIYDSNASTYRRNQRAKYMHGSASFSYQAGGSIYDGFRVDTVPEGSRASQPKKHVLATAADVLGGWGRKLIGAACPVNAYVENGQGHRSGFLADGSYVNEIADVLVKRVATGDFEGDSLTVFYAPVQESLTLHSAAYADGAMNLEQMTPSANGGLELGIAPEISLTSSTIVTFTPATTGPSVVEVDTNGDGIPDESMVISETAVDSDGVVENESGAILSSESLSLDGGSIPNHWILEIIRNGPGLANDRLEGRATDSGADLWREVSFGSNVQELILSYQGGLSTSFWGMQAMAFFELADGVRVELNNIKATANFGNSNVIAVTWGGNERDARTWANTTGTFQFSWTINESAMTGRVFDESGSTLLVEESFAVPPTFSLDLVQKVGFRAYQTTGSEPAWIDNLLVEVSGVASGVFVEQVPDGHAVAELEAVVPYPNPSSDSITIPFSVERTGAVQIIILDVLGRRTAEFKADSIAPGLYEQRVPVSRLSPGVYKVMIVSGSSTKTGSFVVMR